MDRITYRRQVRQRERDELRGLLLGLDNSREATYFASREQMFFEARDRYVTTGGKGAYVSVALQAPTWVDAADIRRSGRFPDEASIALDVYDPEGDFLVLFSPWKWTPICGHWLGHCSGYVDDKAYSSVSRRVLFVDNFPVDAGFIPGDKRVDLDFSRPKIAKELDGQHWITHGNDIAGLMWSAESLVLQDLAYKRVQRLARKINRPLEVRQEPWEPLA